MLLLVLLVLLLVLLVLLVLFVLFVLVLLVSTHINEMECVCTQTHHDEATATETNLRGQCLCADPLPLVAQHARVQLPASAPPPGPRRHTVKTVCHRGPPQKKKS